MRKFLTILLACTAILLCSSCQKAQKIPYVFPDPEFHHMAQSFVNNAENINPGDLVRLDLNESGNYTLILAENPDDLIYSNRYRKNETSWILEGFGTAQVTEDSKADDTVTLIITPLNGESITFTCTHVTADTSSDLFRSWNVISSRITLSGSVNANADFDGCDFNRIAAFLGKNGIAVDEVPVGQKIDYIDFSCLGTITINYQNGNVDYATWTGTPAHEITYKWNSTYMGYAFESGRMSISFEDKNCILTMDATLKSNAKDTKSTLILVLEEYKKN